MLGIFRANKHVITLSKSLRSYSSIAVGVEDISSQHTNSTESVVVASTTTKSSTTPNSSTIQQILKNLPSAKLTESYRLSSVLLSDIHSSNNSRDDQIRQELVLLRDQRDYPNLIKILEVWSSKDIKGMMKVLGHETVSNYLGEIISFGHLSIFRHYNLTPILNSIKVHSSSRSKRKFTPHDITKSIRNIYSNILYDTNKSREHIYDREKRKDIYASGNLTGSKLSVSDFENLIRLELSNFKVDLASRWFKLFRKYQGGDELYKLKMTPELWKLVFRMEAGGDNKLWIIKPTELSNISYNPMYRRGYIGQHVNFSIQDIQDSSVWSDLDLEFHGCIVQHFGYNGKIDILKKYVETIWGINSKGQLSGTKLSKFDRLYPDLKFLSSLFVSLAYNGEFYYAIKYVNNFQKIYDEMDNTQLANKNFWERVFHWANISTSFTEENALKYFLKQSNYIGEGVESLTLQELTNDVDFDYEGYLQFLNKLKVERCDIFNQIWQIIHQEEENFGFSNYIYKLYLNFLKEHIIPTEVETEQKYYDYLSILLKKYQLYHVDAKSFTKRGNLGFFPTNDIDKSIRVLYTDALRALIDYKGEQLKIGHIEPLINEWSLDNEMRLELEDWVANDRIKYYKEKLETRREQFMNNLRSDDNDNDSLLDLM